MKLRFVMASALLAAVCAASGASAAEREVTLAVLAEQPELARVAALVEVALSQKRVRLVERAELDRVLQEQELSAAGLTERQALVKVGRLLRADAFLLLSVDVPRRKKGEEQKPGLLRMRLAETVHGIRLLECYARWERDKTEDAAAEVLQEVLAPLEKLSVPGGATIPVGILGMQRVLLGDEHEWLCRTLEAMLLSRLSKEPRIVVLEREDLKLLQEEKGLTEGAGDAFWAASVLVTGELRWAEKGEVALRLRVSPAGAEERVLGPFVFDPGSPLSAVREAGDSLLAALGSASPASSWDPKNEAGRVSRQAGCLMQRRDVAGAFSLLETAFALDPDNVSYGLALLSYMEAPWSPKGPWCDVTATAVLAGRLARLVRERCPDREPVDKETIELQWAIESYLQGERSRATERVIELNRTTRQIVAETHAQWDAADEEKAGPVSGLAPASVRAMPVTALMTAGTREEMLSKMRRHVTTHLMPPSAGGRDQSLAARCDACMSFIAAFQDPATMPSQVEADFWNPLLAFFAELASSSDPLVAFTGSVLATGPINMPSPLPEGLTLPLTEEACAAKAVAVFNESLRSADVSQAGAKAMRQHIVKMLSGCLEMPGAAEHLTGYYEPLIQAGDADAIAVWGVPHHWVSLVEPDFDPLPYCRLAELQARLVDVLRAAPPQWETAVALRSARIACAQTRDTLRSYLWDAQRSVSALRKGGWTRSKKPLDTLVQEVAEINRTLSAAAPPLSPPPRVAMLLRPQDAPRAIEPGPFGFMHRSVCRLAGDDLWITMLNYHDRPRGTLVSLIGIDLKARKVRAFWQAVAKGEPNDGSVMPGIVLSPTASYAMGPGTGLVMLPAADQSGNAFYDTASLVGADGSLPRAPIQAAAFHDGKLWLAMGGVLGTYSVEAGVWEVVAGGEGGGKGAWRSIRAVAQMATVGQHLLLAPGNTSLWVLAPGAEEPERVCGIPFGTEIVCASGMASLRAPWFLARLLPDEKRVEMLVGEEFHAEQLAAGGPHWQIESTQFIPPFPLKHAPPALGLGEADVHRGAIHGDQLWAHYGRHQIAVIPRGGTIDEAKFMLNNILDGEAVIQFVSTPYGLVGIGQCCVGLIETEP